MIWHTSEDCQWWDIYFGFLVGIFFGRESVLPAKVFLMANEYISYFLSFFAQRYNNHTITRLLFHSPHRNPPFTRDQLPVVWLQRSRDVTGDKIDEDIHRKKRRPEPKPNVFFGATWQKNRGIFFCNLFLLFFSCAIFSAFDDP
jgi:hypothetical protein